MLPISEQHFAVATDHGALMVDLLNLAGKLAKGEGGDVPLAALESLGVNLLNAAPGDFGALPIRWDPERTFEIGNLPAFTAFHGNVIVPALLGAAIAGRTDLRARFEHGGRFIPERALQWLVCHGINEHRLWHGLTARFVADLLCPSIVLAIGKVPPLALLLMQERPDLRGRFVSNRKWSPEEFDSWLGDFGIKDYGLFWCLGKAHVRRWNGRDWPASITKPESTSLSEADPTSMHFRQPAIEWVQHRTEAWQKSGRLFPPFELEASGTATKLVSKGRMLPSKRGLTLEGSRIELVVPRPRAREGFLMVEFVCPEWSGKHTASLQINGLAAATGVIQGAGSQVAIGWTGTIAGKDRSGSRFDALALDLDDGLGEGARARSFELLRIWNL